MIALIDYGAGNIRSVQNALTRLGTSATLTRDHALIMGADKVIFPGVGAAGHAMQQLQETGLDKVIPLLRQPVLGICLGMQLMCAHSEEGDTAALGIFPERVQRFPATGKVPHMGWNSCSGLRGPLFAGIPEETDFYFVHSYYASQGADTSASCAYLLPFSAALWRDNFHGVQFHPEKSSAAGQRLLLNFLNL